MIRAEDAIAAARRLIGTPYEKMDCIGLIKKVIRIAPGGVSGYTTAGTNTLWDSYNASSKYRDLTWRQEGISAAAETSSGSSSHLPQRGRLDAAAGMLAFKRSGEDVHHVGLVTGEGTVIHSSSVKDCVVETPLTEEEGWNLLGKHRHIAVEEKPSAQETQHEKENDTQKRSTMLMREDGIVIELAGCWIVAVD